MKKLLLLYCSLILFISLYSQNKPTPIGGWRLHLSYKNVVAMTETNSQIYCATDKGLFAYNKNGEEISRLSPASGFYGFKASALNYSFEKDVLIISYTDGTIETIVKGNKNINQDITRKQIIGEKKTNHILFYNDIAFMSTTFGLIEYDYNKNEIKNSYQSIGPGGTTIEIKSSAILNDSIYICTKNGIYRAYYHNSVNLADFNNWTLFKSATVHSKFIAEYKGKLVAELDSQLLQYQNKTWTNYEPGTNLMVTNIDVCHNQLVIGLFSKHIIKENASGNKYYKNVNILTQALVDKSDEYWYSSSFNGLVYMSNSGEINYIPNGPRSNDNFQFINAYNQFWVSSGDYNSNNFAPNFNYNKAYIFDNFTWYESVDNAISNSAYDYTHMAFDANTNRLFIGSFGKGLVQFNNKIPTQLYDQNNSPLKLRSNQFCIINGLAFDKTGNLWMSNFDVDSSLVKLNKNGTFERFSTPVSFTGKIVIDSKGNKWILTPKSGVGIVVFNDKGTARKNDDVYLSLNTGVGSGNLPSINISDIAFTKSGELLIGSDQGLSKISTPNNVFTSGNYDAKRIIVSVEENSNLGGYLLGSEVINCITIDGGDRRWIGTTNGAWLIDKDGETILHHFTKENTPLPSDNVRSIGIFDATGEVFFGTTDGIASYKSDASPSKKNLENVVIYPNPVRPDFDGEIAITGLIDNSLVKITDINGNLVYQTYSNGGTATWNCRTFDGTRPSTGIYLAFVINAEGTETGMGKILFVN